MSAVPKLRFPEFDGRWEHSKIGKFLSWHKQKTKVENEFPVMSSSRAGLVLQSEYYGENRITLRSNIGFNVIPPNYVTFRNRSDDRKFFFNTNRTGTSGAISQFYPVFDVVNADKDFLVLLLNLKQHELGILSVGTSQTVLSNTELTNVKFAFPSLPEQQKIASFLSSVDKKIGLLHQKKDALELYKKGLMQKIFSQEIRFKQDDGSDFSAWEEVALGDVLHEHKEKSAGQEPVFSVSVSKGLVDQIEHLGRSFSAADTGHYNKAKPHDVIYTKSPTGNFPLGIIKQSTVGFDVIVSPLYGVFTPETPALGFILNAYFESEINAGNYLSPLVQKGAKNTIACTNKRFLEGGLLLPRSHDEQRKIADFLAVIQKKIAVTSSQIEQMETFKKGLLQQMFV
jgi:type I restriction enzyme, S subunit